MQPIRVFDVGHFSCWTNTGRGEVRGVVPIWPPQSAALNCVYPSQWHYTQCGPAVAVMFSSRYTKIPLTYWGQVMHIMSVQHSIIASDNGLVSVQCQAIIWTNAAIFSIRPQDTYFSEILENAFENIVCEMVTILSQPQCVEQPKIPQYKAHIYHLIPIHHPLRP